MDKKKQNLMLLMCSIIIILQIINLNDHGSPVKTKNNTVNTAQPIQSEIFNPRPFVDANNSITKTKLNLDKKQFETLVDVVSQVISSEMKNKNFNETDNSIARTMPSQNEIQLSNDNYQIIESQILGITKYSSPNDIEDFRKQVATLVAQDKEEYIHQVAELFKEGMVEPEVLILLLP